MTGLLEISKFLQKLSHLNGQSRSTFNWALKANITKVQNHAKKKKVSLAVTLALTFIPYQPK